METKRVKELGAHGEVAGRSKVGCRLGCTSCCRVLKSGKSRYGGGRLGGSREGETPPGDLLLSPKAYLSAAYISGPGKRPMIGCPCTLC
jgi:hypothetical protein